MYIHIPVVVAAKYLNVIDKPVELCCSSLSGQVCLAGTDVSSARMFTRFAGYIDVSCRNEHGGRSYSAVAEESGGESGRPSARFKTPPVGDGKAPSSTTTSNL